MNILIVHQNFPGQFRHIAPVLAAQKGNRVVAFSMNGVDNMSGVEVIKYGVKRGTSRDVHPWVAETETKVIRGEAAFRAALQLKARGFEPELIIAHPGWGESLFLKQVWPDSKLLMYCEFHYASSGIDIGFDAEFLPHDLDQACRVQMKNVNNWLHFAQATAGISPTHWQKSTFPEPFRSVIDVIHDGIDTNLLLPKADVRVRVGNTTLSRADEIITFVNRNLEPYRGYHIFMRSLPEILKQRPNAQVLIVGEDGVSYGAKRSDGQSWKNVFLNEVKDRIDLGRVHFLGRVSYPNFVALLQLSSVHVYLTYPFVLSWSVLEAMSCGCAIVASDTPPVREVIAHDKTGRLFPFFDHKQLSHEVISLLSNEKQRKRLGKQARASAIRQYDLKTICLPRQLRLVNQCVDA